MNKLEGGELGYKLNKESSMSYEDVKIIEELIERKIILTERLMRKIGISKESLLYRIQKINSSLLHNECNGQAFL